MWQGRSIVLKIGIRSSFAILLTITVLLLAFGYILEYFFNVRPCLLCLLQRFAFLGVALFALVACLHFSAKYIAQRVYASLILICCLLGAAVSVRQLYLQSLPASINRPCMPGMQYLMQTMGFFHAMKLILAGSSDCRLVHWQFLGLSMAGWSLIWFAIFGLICVRIFFLTPKHKM